MNLGVFFNISSLNDIFAIKLFISSKNTSSSEFLSIFWSSILIQIKSSLQNLPYYLSNSYLLLISWYSISNASHNILWFKKNTNLCNYLLVIDFGILIGFSIPPLTLLIIYLLSSSNYYSSNINLLFKKFFSSIKNR